MLLGVTGCPGSGKSMLSSVIAEYGWELVNADAIGKEVVDHDTGVCEKLAESFGKDIIRTDRSLDRRLLAKRAFASAKATRMLNGIVHPPLIARLRDIVRGRNGSGSDAVVDCALIFEWAIESLFDVVVCVHADRDIRIRRIMERDGRSGQEVVGMFDAQLPEDEKIRKSHIAVANNDDAVKMRLFGTMLAGLSRHYRETRLSDSESPL